MRLLRTGDGPGYVVESRYVRKDGAIIWVRKSASLTRGAEAGRRWIVKLVEDVTERKRVGGDGGPHRRPAQRDSRRGEGRRHLDRRHRGPFNPSTPPA